MLKRESKMIDCPFQITLYEEFSSQSVIFFCKFTCKVIQSMIPQLKDLNVLDKSTMLSELYSLYNFRFLEYRKLNHCN